MNASLARLVTRSGLLALAATVLAAPALLGCDITKMTANGTSKLFVRAAPGLEQHWDYELAGEALPGNIVQMEGLLRVVPENEILVTNAIKLYTAYAYGWIEDRVEQLQMENNYAEAEEQLTRARYMYMRARDLSKHLISLEHEGFDEAYEGGLEEFEEWLDTEFDTDEPEDAPGLFFAGYSWASYINASKSNMAAVADLPFAVALVERSVEIDPTFFNGSGTVLLAVVATASPGADLDEALPKWQRALEVTEGKNLLVKVNMARTYAVKRQDREMYIRLLTEVLEAGDINPEGRLQNMIAKRRAERYLQQVDQKIPQAATPPPAESGSDEADEPEDETPAEGADEESTNED
jgi:tetratricopeptide (TPR) repeat protein